MDCVKNIIQILKPKRQDFLKKNLNFLIDKRRDQIFKNAVSRLRAKTRELHYKNQ